MFRLYAPLSNSDGVTLRHRVNLQQLRFLIDCRVPFAHECVHSSRLIASGRRSPSVSGSTSQTLVCALITLFVRL